MDPKAMKAYLGDKKVLIYDSVSTSRVAIRNLVNEYGVPSENVILLSNVKEIEQNVHEKKPHIIFMNFIAEDRYSYQILKNHKSLYPNRGDSGFFVISDQNSLSIALHVLNQDFDGFFIRPFTLQTLETTFCTAMKDKVVPGKEGQMNYKAISAYTQGKLEEAKDQFLSVIEKFPHSIPPYYYLGQIFEEEKRTSEALKYYQMGIDRNNKNYRCMRSVLQLLLDVKDYEKAYEMMNTLNSSFPIDPDLIPVFTKVCISNKKFDDILYLCDILVQLENKSEFIRQHVAAALVISGSYLLDADVKIEKAVKVLEDSVNFAGNNIKILQYCLENLLDHDQFEAANNILKELKSSKQLSSDEHELLDYEVSKATGPVDAALLKGLKMIDEDKASFTIYVDVIDMAVQSKRQDISIENLLKQASDKFPEQKEFLQKKFAQYLHS